MKGGHLFCNLKQNQHIYMYIRMFEISIETTINKHAQEQKLIYQSNCTVSSIHVNKNKQMIFKKQENNIHDY